MLTVVPSGVLKKIRATFLPQMPQPTVFMHFMRILYAPETHFLQVNITVEMGFAAHNDF